MSSPKEPYDPQQIILKQFIWAWRNMKKYKGTPDEKRFRAIAEHLLVELKKYIFEK